ncbi:unnamed protein product [Spirodela intermedia]|uniref:Uncharacterized protein n=1 Tax=Spirodela intermedia TaxID=51605 RepID=A0A7I8J3M5_SPIIN|nr:unnamed protein product [Spirodela intermedia]CAA6663991.1 unnamed protein product [Spirodela intermedia]
MEDDDEEEEEEDEEEDEDERKIPKPINKKVLEQEPEILPCRASASPLSPQLSLVGTPRVPSGPSIKVWDPCNVLAPAPVFSRDRVIEVFLISHGECSLTHRPDLIGGRWPAAGLTGNGERQARALAVFLNSQGVRFNAVYSSPLDRAMATAAAICRELGFSKEEIQSSDSLTEMSQGQWEGCHRSEVYTPHMVSLIEQTQPDFCAPSGESLRQVEFRMVEFLNRTVLGMPEKFLAGDHLLHQNDGKDFSRQGSTSSAQDRNGQFLSQWDLLHRHGRQGVTRKRSGKSRLQFVATGDNEAEEELSPRDASNEASGTRGTVPAIAIFSHAMPIKCLLAGLLGCSPAASSRICIDDSSISVLWHSPRTGWQIKRLNDTAHLRLL